jgi:formate hydrogenlyase subunit 6/NADH:ubiquinone oxidoreductase subunit I
MATEVSPVSNRAVIERDALGSLIQSLARRGFQVVGPTVRENAIVYDRLSSLEDLPVGWTDEQDGGVYRLKRRDDAALFGYNAGPHSWKQFLLPPVQRLWQAKREAGAFQILPDKIESPKYAFVGVRACELHAIAIQDKVFFGGTFAEPGYKSRRDNLFLVAVNCGQACGTCFCVSMNTGPKATRDFDLALTEILDTGRHYFVVEVGSEAGASVLSELPHRPATTAEEKLPEAVASETASHMGRTMDTHEIKELLYRNSEHPRWENVAARCLTCANCTMVCPTCFCTTVEDVTDLTGEHAERWRKWDSCFTMDFSYIHGGSVRATPKSRYRQWMTHKLATWFDQFGTSGCVGCGRCITWCPVAIDITQEVCAIRETDSAAAATHPGRNPND